MDTFCAAKDRRMYFGYKQKMFPFIMTNVAGKFLTDFHSIEGKTLEERRKNYFKLFNNAKDINFTELKPQSYLEENIKIDALIYFKRIPELLETLKSENLRDIAKILRYSSHFLEDAFININGEQLVTEIFPDLSFNTKLKLLHKLALYLNNPEKAEDYFEKIIVNYSLYFAGKLLPSCTANFILNTIRSTRIEITPRQLKNIIKKYPEVTEDILEALNTENNKTQLSEKYKYNFIYLMKNNFILFLKLNKKYKINFTLGRRATKTICRKEGTKIVENSKDLNRFLKKRQCIQALKDKFPAFYFNMFPKHLSQFKEEYDNLILFITDMKSNEEKFTLFTTTFKKIHETEVLDNPIFVDKKLLEIMPSAIREAWMEKNAPPNEMTENQWMSFMKTEKSIPLLKERISFTSNIKTRAEIIPYLVKTCKINKDKAALGEVCRYIVESHQNDHWRVRQGFLRTIMECYKMEELGEEHWKSINLLVRIGIANGEHYYGNEDYFKGYFKYCVTNNLSVKDEVNQWIQSRCGRFDMEESKYQKQLLLMTADVVSLSYSDSQITYGYIDYLGAVSKWNNSNPNNKISLLLFPEAMDHLKEALKKNEFSWSVEAIILEYIQLDITEAEETALLALYFNSKKLSLSSGLLLKWLLMNKPQYVSKHIEVVAKSISNNISSTPRSALLFKYLKNYSFMGLPEKMVLACVDALQKDNTANMETPDFYGPSRLLAIFQALSILMSTEEFLNLIKAYYPDTTTVDLHTDQGKRLYDIHKNLAAVIKNINPPSYALKSILKFCKGDYLAFIQNSLNLISLNVSEHKLPDFLNRLSTRSVSVRKSAIVLRFRIFNNRQLSNFTDKLKSDNNSSIRKTVFKGSFNLFINNPNENTWSLLQENVRMLNIKDSEAFNILTNWKRVSSSYIGKYFMFSWNIFESLPCSANSNKYKSQVLNGISANVIPMLSNAFCMKLIKKHLFKSSLDDFQMKIHTFTCICLIYSKSEIEQEELLKATMEILQNYIESSWYTSTTCIQAHKSVYNFIKQFCLDFIDEKCREVKIFHRFSLLWNNILKPRCALSEHLYLQFTDICIKSASLLQIGDELYKDYENSVSSIINEIDTFRKSLKQFTNNFLKSDIEHVREENRYILIDRILNGGNSCTNRLVLSIFLLPDSVPCLPTLIEKYNSIIKLLLLEGKEPTVSIYLQRYFLDVEQSNIRVS